MKPKTKPSEENDAIVGGYLEMLEQVGKWIKQRQGRGVELSTVLRVKPYQVHDWFVAKRYDPPGWVVFAVPKVLIAGILNPSTAEPSAQIEVISFQDEIKIRQGRNEVVMTGKVQAKKVVKAIISKGKAKE